MIGDGLMDVTIHLAKLVYGQQYYIDLLTLE